MGGHHGASYMAYLRSGLFKVRGTQDRRLFGQANRPICQRAKCRARSCYQRGRRKDKAKQFAVIATRGQRTRQRCKASMLFDAMFVFIRKTNVSYLFCTFRCS